MQIPRQGFLVVIVWYYVAAALRKIFNIFFTQHLTMGTQNCHVKSRQWYIKANIFEKYVVRKIQWKERAH